MFRLNEIFPAGRIGLAEVPVLGYGPAEHLSTAWEAGCTDYLKEPWTITELHFRVDRLRATRGGSLTTGKISLLETEIICGDKKCGLSAQEMKILALLLRHPRVVVPREALYYAIWGKAGTGSRTVDVHISSLRKKLAGLQCSLQPEERIEIKTARRLGYVIR
ncbi:MAG: response regulator transcription factor [Spirochaetales bacterium]|nr:response regulator transcription factor [Spirochaetales bacterium]